MMHAVGKWGKRLLTGFFVLIFALGFFSKSLLNITLPNVQIAELYDGVEVDYTSELAGEIVAKKSADICLKGDAIIQEVLVKKGSYVRVGTPLFRIDTALGVQNSNKTVQLENKIRIEQARIETLVSKSDLDYQTEVAQNTTALNLAAKSLKEQEQLLKNGAISNLELTTAQNALKALQAQQQVLLKNRTLQNSQDQVALSEIKQSIADYQSQLTQLSTKSDRYYETNAIGEALSKYEGYVTKVPEKGSSYRSGEIIAVVGICKTYEDLAFEIRLSQRDYNGFSEQSNMVDLSTLEGRKIGLVRFDYDSATFSDGEVSVLANFNEEPDIQVFPSMKVASRTKSSYTIGGERMAIPRTAIVSSGSNLNGENALIYLLQEEEDALGKSQVAVATPVQVISVGDDFAVVQELRNLPSNKVIINPTAKIKDGTKVYVCP